MISKGPSVLCREDAETLYFIVEEENKQALDDWMVAHPNEWQLWLTPFVDNRPEHCFFTMAMQKGWLEPLLCLPENEAILSHFAVLPSETNEDLTLWPYLVNINPLKRTTPEEKKRLDVYTWMNRASYVNRESSLFQLLILGLDEDNLIENIQTIKHWLDGPMKLREKQGEKTVLHAFTEALIYITLETESENEKAVMDVWRLLLLKGANPEAVDEKGKTPLMSFLEETGGFPIHFLHLMIEDTGRAQVSQNGKLTSALNIMDKEGRNALMEWMSAILKERKNPQHQETFDRFIEAGTDLNVHHVGYNSPFHHMAIAMSQGTIAEVTKATQWIERLFQKQKPAHFKGESGLNPFETWLTLVRDSRTKRPVFQEQAHIWWQNGYRVNEHLSGSGVTRVSSKVLQAIHNAEALFQSEEMKEDLTQMISSSRPSNKRARM